MRSSKDRTIQKKRINKDNKIARTERSRKQRTANKHKREEIHAIDPDMKVIVMNHKTFDEYGTEIEIVDGAIKAVEPEITTELADFDSAVEEYQEIIDKHPADNTVLGEVTIIEEIKLKNKSALQRLTSKFKKGLVL